MSNNIDRSKHRRRGYQGDEYPDEGYSAEEYQGDGYSDEEYSDEEYPDDGDEEYDPGPHLSLREKSHIAQLERAKKRKKKMKTMIITAAGIIVALALVIGAGIMFSQGGKKDKSKKKNETKPQTTAAADNGAKDTAAPTGSTPKDTPTKQATPTEEPVVDNRPKYTVPDLHETDNTVHLISAVDYAIQLGTYDPNSILCDFLELTPLASAADPPRADENAVNTKNLVSNYMVLIDADTGEVVAERSGSDVINPASMTKVLTVLTAMDYLTDEDMNKTIHVGTDTLEYVIKNECSAVGYEIDQEVSVKDLLYGTIVCSGGDAALELAKYVAGSVDAFVELMNKRCEEFGISKTAHFTNPVGIYDENLHCTPKDMAVIMTCAMQNEKLRDVLGTRIYKITTYEENHEPYEISNWFIRRIEDKDTNGKVLGAKTGFVSAAGSCAVSYLESSSGRHYVCCTGRSSSSWRCIYDHVSVYRCYTE